MTTPRRTDQKDRIRKQAARLFAEKGYEGTGVQELSDAVGLGRGALYHHIGSKEQLLYDVVTVHTDEVLALGRTILALDCSGEEKLRQLSRVTMSRIARNLPEWTVFFRDLDALSPPLRRKVLVARREIEDIWIAVVRQGAVDGEFVTVDPVLIKGVLGMFNYAYVWIRPRGRLSPEEIADLFCDTLLGGLRAERP
jgi:AcrR family transcriptional regulator